MDRIAIGQELEDIWKEKWEPLLHPSVQEHERQRLKSTFMAGAVAAVELLIEGVEEIRKSTFSEDQKEPPEVPPPLRGRPPFR